MINYQNSKVYKIINENNEIIYIGSTAQELLCDRYKTHKHKAPNHKIILIENYPCNSRQELCMREQQVMEEHNNLLNMMKAYQSQENRKEYKKKTDENYRLKHKKKIKKYFKELYENNKDDYKIKRKKQYEKQKNYVLEKISCEFCGTITARTNISNHKKTKKCLKFQNL